MLGLSRPGTKDDEVANDFQGEVGTVIFWVQWPATLLEPLRRLGTGLNAGAIVLRKDRNGRCHAARSGEESNAAVL